MIKRFLEFFVFWVWGRLCRAAWVVWTICRPALRFMSAVLTIAAVFALTADVTRWQIGETAPLFYSLSYHIQAVAPATFKAMEATVSTTSHPLVWEYGLLVILSLPAWLVLTLLAMTIAVIGRERQRVNIFIN